MDEMSIGCCGRDRIDKASGSADVVAFEIESAVAPYRGGDVYDAPGIMDERVQCIGFVEGAVYYGAVAEPVRQAAATCITNQQAKLRIGEGAPERIDSGLSDKAGRAGHGDDRHRFSLLDSAPAYAAYG